MRQLVKTAALLVAAVVYVPLVIDWCMPGNGLHQATVALGGYGPDALRPFSCFFVWDPLVRLIGWNLHGLGMLSMFAALVSLGLIAYSADRIAYGNAPLSTGLVCAAFIVTPGFLQAATRPDPLMTLLVFPLIGLVILVHLLTEPGYAGTTERIRRNPLTVVCSLLFLAYGIFGFTCLGLETAVENGIRILWFAVLGILPHLFLVRRLQWRAVSRGFQFFFYGIWIAAITLSAVVAARSFNLGRASGHLAEQLIANAGDSAVRMDAELADVYLWTLSSEQRGEVAGWISEGKSKARPDAECYFPTVDLWREALVRFKAMSRHEPHWNYYRRLLLTCGNRFGRRLLDAGDLKGAWSVFWDVLSGIDGEDGVAILNLCGLIERGQEADPASREILGRRLLWLFRGLKMSERLMEEKKATAKTVQRTIQSSIASGLVRLDQIGRKLLDLDLLLGDWESAERDAQGILFLDRQNIQANTVMGNVRGRQGNYSDSERYLRQALASGRAGISVTNDLAFTLVCMGHAKEALPLARALVQADQENWNFRETLALSLIKSGEPEAGGQELRAAANLARRAKVPARAQIRLAMDRAWLFKATGDTVKLEQTLRILKNLEGLEKGLLMEINEIEK